MSAPSYEVARTMLDRAETNAEVDEAISACVYGLISEYGIDADEFFVDEDDCQ